MCRLPVTLGGGITSEKTSRPGGILRRRWKNAALDPQFGPVRLEPLGLIDFLNLHGNLPYIMRP